MKLRNNSGLIAAIAGLADSEEFPEEEYELIEGS